MNGLHRWYCQTDHWRRTTQNEILPWALNGIDLGDNMLEVGPGPGVTTDWLLGRTEKMECLEVDPSLAILLDRRLAQTNAIVRCGDATKMPYEDRRFSAVVSFTMLHHISTPKLQNQFFCEALRVLQPGGVFAGVDSLSSIVMHIFHIRDTMTLVAPKILPKWLETVGFTDVRVEIGSGRFRFSARRPYDSTDILHEFSRTVADS